MPSRPPRPKNKRVKTYPAALVSKTAVPATRQHSRTRHGQPSTNVRESRLKLEDLCTADSPFYLGTSCHRLPSLVPTWTTCHHRGKSGKTGFCSAHPYEASNNTVTAIMKIARLPDIQQHQIMNHSTSSISGPTVSSGRQCVPISYKQRAHHVRPVHAWANTVQEQNQHAESTLSVRHPDVCVLRTLDITTIITISHRTERGLRTALASKTMYHLCRHGLAFHFLYTERAYPRPARGFSNEEILQASP